MWLAQIDTYTVETAVVHIEKQPWVAVVGVLCAICATLIAGLIWFARSGIPWMDRRQQSSQDHVLAMLTARGKESERDIAQVTEQLVGKLEDKIDRQTDSIAGLRTELARVAAKVCVGVVLIILAAAMAGDSKVIAQGLDFTIDRRPSGLYGAR